MLESPNLEFCVIIKVKSEKKTNATLSFPHNYHTSADIPLLKFSEKSLLESGGEVTQ